MMRNALTSEDIEKYKYPVGKHIPPTALDFSTYAQQVEIINAFPKQLAALLADLKPEQLQYRYRPESWTMLQVIHHLADSHMNGFIRTKLALTEENPTIKPYLQDAWVQTSDVLEVDFSLSLGIINGVHARWAKVLAGLNEADLNRTFFHPELKTTMPIWKQVALYAWHCKTHFGHLEFALQNKFEA